MSQRGSFVTEYIYCSKCLEAAKKVLLSDEKYLNSQQILSWEGDGSYLPIIAGKLGGSYSGQELIDFEYYYAKDLAKEICCPMRVAVIAETDVNEKNCREKIFYIKPNLLK